MPTSNVTDEPVGRAGAIFEGLPRPLKLVAFAGAGWARERMRYGGAHERLIEEARDREGWSAAQWQEWYDRELPPFLRDAASSVPAYRALWNQPEYRRRDPEDLSNWPVLSRQTLRADAPSFVSQRAPKLFKVADSTSGSSGTPLTVVSSFDTQRRWYALFEARVRNWHGVTRTDRWAILGGRMVSPFEQREPPFWIWNPAMRQLYCSSYHISTATAEAYAEALSLHRVRYLVGYPSAIAALANAAIDAGVELPPMKAIIGNAEPVLNAQRSAVEAAFHTPIRETYGMAEMVAAASECPQGSLHASPEAGYLELVDDEDRPVNHPGEEGRIIATGLINPAMPLVRYEIGDRGSNPTSNAPCPCGRHLPYSPSIEGRIDDVVLTSDGRQIGRLDKIITPDLPVREAQIVQRALDRFEIKIVAAPGWSEQHRDKLVAALRSRVGGVVVNISFHDRLPRTANGKLRTVVCELG